jgi:3-hydroxy-9,10-secoandrosta-1,3,5(10)-triene-9,17-dione monooxygenase reductase component
MYETARPPYLGFRDVLGCFPTGVAVVTAIGLHRRPVGMAINSFTSASLVPPLVAFFPAKASTSFPKMKTSASFCINILSQEQEQLSRRFSAPGIDRFDGIRWRPAPSGAPILDGVLAWIDSTPTSIHDAGDHFVMICEVLALAVEDATRRPLIFFQSSYANLA